VAELVAHEERARGERRLEHWLHALGNTRHPGTLAAVERYLAHDDAALRHAALSALRHQDAPRATAALLERARSERDPRVRAVALEGLAQRRDAAALEYLAGVLASDPSAAARHAVVAGLARQLAANPAVRPLLEQAAHGDPAREVRNLAAQALAH
jgi:HEAT repeat protein